MHPERISELKMFLSFDYLHRFNCFTDGDIFGLLTGKKYKPVAKEKKEPENKLRLCNC